MQQDQYQTQPAHINQNRHISTIITTPLPPPPRSPPTQSQSPPHYPSANSPPRHHLRHFPHSLPLSFYRVTILRVASGMTCK